MTRNNVSLLPPLDPAMSIELMKKTLEIGIAAYALILVDAKRPQDNIDDAENGYHDEHADKSPYYSSLALCPVGVFTCSRDKLEHSDEEIQKSHDKTKYNKRIKNDMGDSAQKL